MVNTIGSAGRNQWGNTFGMSAQQANDQYMRGLGGGIGQGSQRGYYSSGGVAGTPYTPFGMSGSSTYGSGWAAGGGAGGGGAPGKGGGGGFGGAGGGGGGAGTGGGQYTTSINTAPVWSPQQILEGQTQRREQAGAQAATQQNALRNSLAGSGFNGNSLAAQDLAASAAQRGQIAGNEAANQFAEQAQQANRGVQLQSETARANEGLALANILEGGRQANQRVAGDQAMALFRALAMA